MARLNEKRSRVPTASNKELNVQSALSKLTLSILSASLKNADEFWGLPGLGSIKTEVCEMPLGQWYNVQHCRCKKSLDTVGMGNEVFNYTSVVFYHQELN